MSFLFFSKLLPLFAYPLGLSCCCLILSLVLSWQRSRYAALPVAIALGLLWVSSMSPTSKLLLRSLEQQHLSPSVFAPADAIVVLGGGTRPGRYPRLLPDLTEAGDRVVFGARLYQLGKAPRIVVAGGRITWEGQNKPEAEDMAELLQLFGVPGEAILREPDSLNTYQNATNVRALLAPHGWNHILLVTSARHMPRSVRLFEKQGFVVEPAATDYLAIDANPTHDSLSSILNLLPRSDRLDQTTSALKEYLGLWVYQLRGWL
ncbi:MAG: YdcF family protein [Cyanobacteria bacterium P01_H01_bin.15]